MLKISILGMSLKITNVHNYSCIDFWDAITYPCLRYLLQTSKSSNEPLIVCCSCLPRWPADCGHGTPHRPRWAAATLHALPSGRHPHDQLQGLPVHDQHRGQNQPTCRQMQRLQWSNGKEFHAIFFFPDFFFQKAKYICNSYHFWTLSRVLKSWKWDQVPVLSSWKSVLMEDLGYVTWRISWLVMTWWSRASTTNCVVLT